MSRPLNTKSRTFEEFHERHRDQTSGKRLGWMADFYRAKEGIMFHKEADLKWRVLELGKCRSWGNGNRDYIAQENGEPMTQRQIADLLGVSYKRVCEAVDELVQGGYFGREGQIILVLDDPAAARAERDKQTKKSGTGRISGAEKAKFLQAWAAHHPEQFKEYQQLGKEIEERFERQRAMQETAWEWYQEEQKKSGTGRTSETEDPERGGEKVRDGAEESSGTGRTEDDPNLNWFTSTYLQLASCIKGEPEKLVFEAVGRSGLRHLPGNLPAAIRNTAAVFATEPPERRSAVLVHFQDDCSQIAGRRENKPKSWGILRRLMEDAIRAVSESSADENAEAPEPPPAPSVEEQIESLENLLEAKPDHPQADSWREQIAALKRKPAASEGGEQARKAGQA